MSSLFSDRPAVLPVLGQAAGAQAGSAGPGSRRRRLFQTEWAVGLCGLTFDLLLWVGVFQAFVLLRRDIEAVGAGFQAKVCLVQFAVIMLCLHLVGGYDRRTSFASLNYMSEHGITLLTASGLGGLILYVGHAFGQVAVVSSSVLLGSQLVFAPLSLVGRRALWQVVQTQLGRSFFLVLGKGDQARHLYRANRAAPVPQCMRFVDPDLAGAADASSLLELENPQAPRIESLTFGQFTALLEGSSGVVLAEDHRCLSGDLMEWLSRLHYEKIPVYTLETFYGRYWRRVPVRAIDATWPLQLEAQLAQSSVYAHAKRLMDITLAAAALLGLAPVLGLLALLVSLESGSPAFFRQTRVGRDRDPFTLYKLRTMYHRPAEAAGSLYTATHDPRITPLGRWLRKLRLDELPQLWNVLQGDMSLIGPRAEWDRLVMGYEASIAFYHFRHLVKPGITGWAQVNYPYGASQEDAVEKLNYDLYYIRHYSLRLDAMIVLKTLHTMLWGKGQ